MIITPESLALDKWRQRLSRQRRFHGAGAQRRPMAALGYQAQRPGNPGLDRDRKADPSNSVRRLRSKKTVLPCGWQGILPLLSPGASASAVRTNAGSSKTCHSSQLPDPGLSARPRRHGAAFAGAWTGPRTGPPYSVSSEAAAPSRSDCRNFGPDSARWTTCRSPATARNSPSTCAAVACGQLVSWSNYAASISALFFIRLPGSAITGGEAVAVFADLERFPRRQVFSLERLPGDLIGFEGAARFDFFHSRFRP